MATIQGVYVALFGRPADPLGLTFFNSVTNNGANLSAIGDLSTQKEYTDRFAGQSNVQIITSIYQSLFNRDPDMAGLTFFVNALNNKTFNINNIAIAILDGAQGTDKTIVDAKIASANAFTAAIDTPIEVGAYSGNTAAAAGRAFLADVTTTPKTAAQADLAVSAVVGAGSAGNTVTLAAGTSDVSLTSKVNADLVTTNNNDTINAGANFTVADKIDGGLGTDTLNASIAGAIAVGVDGLKNVELAFINASAAATLDVTEAKQLTQIWNDASGFTLAVNNVALSTTVGLKGAIADAATFGFADVSGTSDVATLALNAATVTATKAVTLAGVETLTISNTGTSVVDTLTVAATKTLNVTGSGTLTLGSPSTAIETVNAGGFSGKLTVDLTAQDAIKSYVGTTGVDAVTIDGVHTNDVTINLGTGNDSLTLTAGDSTKALSVTLGAGNDAVNIATLGNVAAGVDNNTKLLATLVTITDFNTTQDSLKIDLTKSTAADREVLSNVELANIDAAADLFAAVQIVAGTTAIGNNAVFAYKGDTYIYDNAATAGLTTEDTLIKLTGVTVASLNGTNFEVI